MLVRTIKGLADESWDQFVDKSNNGTIFHKLGFLSYHSNNKFNFFNLGFYEKGNLVGILPGELKNNIYISPVGASYGSFVTGDVDFKTKEELIDSFVEFSKSKGIREINLTLPPIIYSKHPNEEQEFLLYYKGFKAQKHLISHAINLELFGNKNEIIKVVPKRYRTDVNKSFKSNITVEFSSDFENFYNILLENKKKFNAKPTHTLEEIVKISKLLPNNIKLLMAFNKSKEPIAGILLVICNTSTVLTFYICHLYKYHELKAVSRLLYESVLWAKENNFRWLDLGVSMDTSSENSMEPSRQLIFFKEATGARGFLRTTFSKTI